MARYTYFNPRKFWEKVWRPVKSIFYWNFPNIKSAIWIADWMETDHRRIIRWGDMYVIFRQNKS